MPLFTVLECPILVYRTIFRKEWIRPDGSFKWQAFKPYRTDTLGVSVFITPEDIDDHSDKPFFGIASVKVGKVRDCSTAKYAVDVVQDMEWHANITGIPYPYLEEDLEDPTIAAKMRDICTSIKDNASRPFNP